MKTLNISGKIIGERQPVFIIAEAGVNHNGDFDVACKMIKAAKDSGADAISFQHIKADKLDSNKFSSVDWNKYLLSDTRLEILCDYAEKLGLKYSVCVIDEESLDLVIGYGISFIKIVSGDITNIPFLKYCAKTGLPIFMSTGGSTLDEVLDAVSAIMSVGNNNIVLYHTNSSYPTPLNDVNLRIMDTLKNEFGFLTGFCDHTLEGMTSIIAIARDACVIEKHLTFDRNKKGPDHEVSLEPSEFKQMVEQIRLVEQILGTPERRMLACEKDLIKISRRSIVAKKNIPSGFTITEDMLTFKRPGTGIQPKNIDEIIGKKTKININENTLIKMEWLK
jgi:N,N'-diacetyllegionaminate synthase